MTAAGKWVLGLLLLVVGAVFVARTVSSDPGSQAQVKLPAAESVGTAKPSDEEKAKAAAEAAAKKVASTVAGDVACKKACIEVNEVANDSVTTAKLAPGSVTLSKLAFEVPNLNELENEINARKATEAALKATETSLKAANAEAVAAGAKNDAAITAAASNGITAEAAARSAADDALGKQLAAGDADLLGKLNKELADRTAADNVLQGKLNTEIADRAGAILNLKGELANPNQVGAPILAINNNEIVGNAVTSDKLLDETITAADLANDSIVGGLGGDIKDDTVAAVDLAADAVVGRAAGETLTNTKARSLRGERLSNTVTTLGAGDLALGTITGEKTPLAGSAVGNIALGTIGTANLADGQITLAKLAPDTVELLDDLRLDLEQEIVDRKADVDKEEADRKTDVDTEETARKADVDKEEADRITDVDKEEADRIADVDKEETDRKADVDKEEQDRIKAVADEATLRSAADATLTSGLSAELTKRAQEDTAIRKELSDAIAAVEAKIKGGNDKLTQEIKDRQDGDAANAQAIADEGTARAAADKTNADAILTEEAARKAGDKTNADALAAEKTDREAGDKTNADALGALKSDLDAPDADLTANDGDGIVHFSNIDGVVVTSAMLADESIEGSDIKDRTITAADLAGRDEDPLTPEVEFQPGAVTSSKLAANAVTFTKLDGDLQGRLTTLEADAGAAKTKIKALEDRVTALATAPGATDTDRVHTTRLKGATTSTVSVDPPAILAGTRFPVAIPLPGVEVGDMVMVSPPTEPGGLNKDLIYTGSDILLANTVTVYLQNPTAGPIDDVAKDWKIRHLDLTP